MSAETPIAILVPVEAEFDPYRALVPDLHRVPGTGPWEVYEGQVGGRRTLPMLCDCGPANAAAATERMIAQFAPAAVLHGGSAGAHNPELLPGDLVLGARCVVHTPRSDREARAARGLHDKLIRFRRDGARVHLECAEGDASLLATAKAVAARVVAGFPEWTAPGWPPALPRRAARALTGVIASADTWTVEAEELRALREHYGAECEDMESAFVGQVCALHGVPFLAVRGISNNDAACALAPEEVTPALAAAGERVARVLVATIEAHDVRTGTARDLPAGEAR